MKTTIILLSICINLILGASVRAQTSVPQLVQPLLNATNYAGTVYGSHFDKANAGGGGLLALYNINQYTAAGLGADWAGNWRVFGGDFKLQYPVQWHGIEFSPFAIVALQSSVGGAGQDNGTLATGEGGGVGVNVWRKLSLQGGWLNRTSCGRFSGGSEFLAATYRF